MADAGIRLTVEGEKEFKAALAEIDAALKTNQKELRALTEDFKLNETGMKAAAEGIGTAAGESAKAFGSMADAASILKTKGEALESAIEKQSQKFEMLSARAEKAAEEYGAQDKRTQALRAQVLDASTALSKLNNEYEKNKQALLDAEHSTKEYDDAVKALEAQLAANQAELKNMGGGLDALKKEYGDLDKGTGELEKSTSTLGKIFGTAGKDADSLAAKEENLRKQNDNLTRQNDKLSDSVKKQRDLVDNLARAQEIATARYGEGSVKAEEYRKKLADATGQLDKMERELQENQKAIEDNNKTIADGGEAPNAMLDGLKKIEEMTGIKIPAGIETMIGGFGGGALAVGGIVTALAEVGKKMESIWRESVQWAEDVTTEAAELDLSTQQYQELEYIATKTGTSVSSLTGALEKIEKKAADAAYTQETLKNKIAAMREEMEKAQASRESMSQRWQETGDERFLTQVEMAADRYKEAKAAVEELEGQLAEATSYFDDLGISIVDTDGNYKDSLTLLYELIDAYAGVESEVIRNYEMNEILGRSYKKLKPHLTEGSEGLKKMVQEGYRTGQILKEELVEGLNEAAISLDEYNLKLERINQTYAAMREKAGVFEDIILYIEQADEVTTEWLAKLAMGSNYRPAEQTPGNSAGGIVSTWLEAILGALVPVAGIAIGGTKLAKLFGFASGTNYAPGGMALVGEQGPEIVELPRGSKVYPNGTAPELAGGSVVNESNTYNITIDAASVEEFNDIVRIAQGARVGMRRG